MIHRIEAQTKLSGFGSITFLRGCSNVPNRLKICFRERCIVPGVEGWPWKVSKTWVKVATRFGVTLQEVELYSFSPCIVCILHQFSKRLASSWIISENSADPWVLTADSWVVVSWQNKHLDLAQQKPQMFSQAGIKGLLIIRDTICLYLYSTSFAIQTSIINTCGSTGMACSVASPYRKWNVWTLILTT